MQTVYSGSRDVVINNGGTLKEATLYRRLVTDFEKEKIIVKLCSQFRMSRT